MTAVPGRSARNDRRGRPTTFDIDFSLVQPLDIQQQLVRDSNRKVTFSVADAIILPDGAEAPNIFWYVSHSRTPHRLQSEPGDTLVLHDCDERISPPLASHSVEAIVTRGDVVISPPAEGSNGETRSTINGEPMIIVRWVVSATGEPNCL
ncbi:MAG: hypothetical protein ACI9OJ_003371 [Myxococcota bacterium]|jgi:hypothetical protein